MSYNIFVLPIQAFGIWVGRPRMDVLVSLKHDGKLSEYLNKAYASKHLCDVEVVTSDQSSFHTHRLVLSAFSEFFQRKITDRHNSYNMVIPIGTSTFEESQFT